jgi:hypothetical protein
MSILDRLIRYFEGSTRRRCGRDQGDLRHDQSGAIMVVGVFISTVLAGAVFFIMGTGDAIVYRQRVQDAADAITYTSAGFHARGMNIIVLINLVMAALLGVLILFRMLIVMLGIAIALCTACVAAGPFCPLSPLCASVLSPMINIEIRLSKASKKYADVLDKALPVLSGLQKVVALSTPYVGAYKGYKVAEKYEPVVTSGFALSPSMVPTTKRLGLPVQEMDYPKFCKKAAELAVGDAAFGWMGAVGSALGTLAGAIAGSFPGFFCGEAGSKGPDIQETIKNDVNKMIKDTCDKQKEDCIQNKENSKSEYCTDMGSLGVEFNTANCMNETKKKVEENKKDSGFSDQGGDIKNTDKKTPKELWAGAKHGGFWFQVFGLSFGDEAWPRRLDKGVAIATSTGQLPKPKTEFGNFRVAQSEFYFDHSGEWDKVKDDAMWKMHWRARLRRVDLNGFNLIEAGLDKLTGYLTKLGGAKLGKWLSGKGTLGALFGQTVYDKATEWLGDAIKSGAGKLGNPIIDSALKNAAMPSWEIIH